MKNMKIYTKTKFIKKISFAIAMVLIINNILPFTPYLKFDLEKQVYAESTTKDSIGSVNMEDDGITIGIDESQKPNGKKTTYSEELEILTEEDKIQGSDVYVSQASSFGVFIPKTIILDGQINEEKINKANYIVRVSENSNIAGKEVISVEPDRQFELYQLGKNPIPASTSQTRKEWAYNELTSIAQGEITSVGMSAGSWNGQFNFNIQIIDYSIYDDIVVSAIDENDVNLNATSKIITGETKETLIKQLEDNGHLTVEDKLSLIIEVESDDFDTTAVTTFNVSKFARVGDKIAIFHYNETTNEWEHIVTGTVDKNGQIVGDFTSFSPIAFINLEYYSIQIPGLYNMNNELIKTWDELIDEGTINVSNSGVLTVNNNNNIYDKLIVANDVLVVGDSAFRSNKKLKEIVLSENTHTIKRLAFDYCTNLQKVTLPVSMNFETDAFSVTQSIKEIILLKGTGIATNLKSANNSTTNNYSHTPWCGKTIDTIIIPEGVTHIGDYYFNRANISKFILPSTLTSIGKYAFSETGILSIGGIGSNSSIEIPTTIKTIPERLFYNCDNLLKVDLPNHITTIDTYAFSFCDKLNEVYLPDSITTIGTYAFSHDIALKKVVIPKNITSLNSYLFEACDSLISIGYDEINSIVLPENLSTIGEHTFDSCESLTKVDLSKNIITLGGFSFRGCGKLKEVILSEKTTTLNNSVFASCSSLNKITLPVSINFYSSAFSATTSLKEIILLKGTGIGTTLKQANSSTTNSYSNTPWSGKTIDTIVIPEGVTTLGNNYFYNAKVSNFILPSTLTTLGESVFSQTNIYSIGEIGSGASIEIPNNLKTIPTKTFYNCDNLTNVTLPSNITTIGEYAFQNCNSLNTIDVSTGVTSIGTYAFSNNAMLKKVILSNKMTTIPTYLFYECDSLTNIGYNETNSVVLQENIKTISDNAFLNCANLTKIDLSNSITTIGNYTFKGCDKLNEVIFGNCLKKIGNYTFYECRNISNIDVPNSVTSIGDKAFYRVPHITYNGTATGSPWGAQAIN